MNSTKLKGSPKKKSSRMDHEQKRLVKEFDAMGETLVWQLKQGGGLKNLHIADTIRELDRLYWINAAYSKAVTDAEDR